MKRALLGASLCVALVAGSYVVAKECASCNESAYMNVQFEQMFRCQGNAEQVKKVYKQLIDKAIRTSKDKKVVAARREVYKAAKNLQKTAQENFVMTAEERKYVACLVKALQKQNAMGLREDLSEEEKAAVLAYQLEVMELAQYPEILKEMFEQEVELFQQS